MARHRQRFFAVYFSEINPQTKEGPEGPSVWQTVLKWILEFVLQLTRQLKLWISRGAIRDRSRQNVFGTSLRFYNVMLFLTSSDLLRSLGPTEPHLSRNRLIVLSAGSAVLCMLFEKN